MRVKTRTISYYVAYDGREFDTAEECVRHEMGTGAGVRCSLAEIGKSRQLCKNECLSAERAIALWRRRALDLLRHRKAMRCRSVAEDIGNAFCGLAEAIGKRDKSRARLRNLHEEQGQLRALLNKAERKVVK